MTIYCRKCGKEMEDDAEFCDECGTPTDPKKETSFSSFNSNYNPFSDYKIDMISGENLVGHSEINSACLILPIAVAAIGLVFTFVLFPFIFLFILGLIWLLLVYMTYSNTDLILTNKRVFGKCGVISTIQMQSPLYMINSVSFSNGLMGKLLGYGTIVVSTASSVYKFRYIRDGQKFSNDIFNQLVLSEKEKIVEQAEAIAERIN